MEKLIKGILKLIFFYHTDREKYNREISQGVSFIIVAALFFLMVWLLHGIYQELVYSYSYFKGEQTRGMRIIDTKNYDGDKEVITYSDGTSYAFEDGMFVEYYNSCDGLLDESKSWHVRNPWEYDANRYRVSEIWTKKDFSEPKVDKEAGYQSKYKTDKTTRVNPISSVVVEEGEKWGLVCRDENGKPLQAMFFDNSGTSFQADIRYFIKGYESERISNFFEAIDIFIIFIGIVLLIVFVWIIKRKKLMAIRKI